jgi:hypothetical protein
MVGQMPSKRMPRNQTQYFWNSHQMVCMASKDNHTISIKYTEQASTYY